MRRSVQWLGWGAVVLAAAAAGCSKDGTAPATRVAGPAAPHAPAPWSQVAGARIAEGARVRVALRDALEIPGVEVPAAARDLAPTEAEGVVANGFAGDARCGAVLAATRDRVEGQREFGYTDEDGHTHRLVLDGGLGRGPLVSARYEKDGEPTIEVAYRWEQRDGASVLREQAVTLRRHGRVVLRHVRTAGAVEVSEGAGAEAEGLPGILRMENAELSCGKQWAVYIGASATLLVAGEVFVLVRTPATAAAVTAATAAWNKAFTSLMDCLIVNAGGA